jgi:hypothetical protein
MRIAGPLLCILLYACGEPEGAPCTEHSTCTPLGQFCIDGHCKSFSSPPDLATPDLTGTMVDLSGCMSSTSCMALTAPICDAVTHACRGCKAGECPAAYPFCMPDGKCAECVNETDCAATQGYCDANQRCVPCTRGADCRSTVCDQGKCIAEGDVTYVDNAATCASADGSQAKPYCQIDQAISTGKKYVKVAGSTVDYPALDIPSALDRALVVVGPGTTAAKAATIAGSTGSALRVMPDALVTSSVTLDGFILKGVPALQAAVVECVAGGGTASLSLRDAIVYNSSGIGIDSNACSLTVERSRIGANGEVGVRTVGPAAIRQTEVRGNKGGLKLSGGYTVENDVIAENPGGPGVEINGSVTGTFRFNTVVGNGDMAAGVGGAVVANGSTVVISHSIIVGNTKVGGTQFANCTLDDTVTGSDAAAGAVQKMPTWLSAFNYHLIDAPANVDCCIDKATAGPSVDRDGVTRPKRNGWDVGAYELP